MSLILAVLMAGTPQTVAAPSDPATSAWAAGEVGDVAVPRTSVLKNTLDPRWPADEAITLELPPRGHGLHRGLHCALVCVDYDVHSADDVIGSCALPLGRWLLDAGAPLEAKGAGKKPLALAALRAASATSTAQADLANALSELLLAAGAKPPPPPGEEKKGGGKKKK